MNGDSLRRDYLKPVRRLSYGECFLPGCLLYTGDLTGVSALTEADTADTVLADVSVGAAADLAAVVFSRGELLLLLLLVDHGFLCHFSLPPITSRTVRP